MTVNKGPGMSSRVCVTGYMRDPVPFIERSRAAFPSGRFPPNFIHQVFIITGLKKLYDLCSCSEDCLRCGHGVNPPLKPYTMYIHYVLVGCNVIPCPVAWGCPDMHADMSSGRGLVLLPSAPRRGSRIQKGGFRTGI